MKTTTSLKTAILASLLAPAISYAAAPALVSNGLDSGVGSLRAALEAGSTKIVIKKSVKTIELLAPLVYNGTAPLSIKGSGQVIGGDNGDQPLLEISAGANLTLDNLEFTGPGGYSIENQGGGKGIFVKIPENRTGTVVVKLNDVVVRNTGNHGVHISDCSLGDDCGGGQGGDGEGSAASVLLELNNVTVDNAGFGKQDADGIRVDDRGDGDIILKAKDVTMINVGGDGIELDEGNNGSVFVKMHHAFFYNNGAYCSDEFVNDPIALDPSCNDDGDPDVDDAFDIDEAGPGGIAGIITHADVIHNYDEGFDFDTEGTGKDNFVNLKFVNIFARDNADEAIKVSEEEDASVYVKLVNIDIGGDVEVEEEGDGNLYVTIKNSSIGDDLKLSESDAGTGTVKIRNTTIADKKDFDNVDEI